MLLQIVITKKKSYSDRYEFYTLKVQIQAAFHLVGMERGQLLAFAQATYQQSALLWKGTIDRQTIAILL